MPKPFHLMPGPKALPVVGSLWRYYLGSFTLPQHHLARQHDFKKYGRIYKETLGPQTLVHILDPKDMAIAFRNEGKYPQRPSLPILDSAFKRDGLPMGFANLNGEEWYKRRQSVHQLMMSPDAATLYLTAQNKVADDFIDLVREVRTDSGLVEHVYLQLVKYTAEAFGAVCYNERLGLLQATTDEKASSMFNTINDYFEALHSSIYEVPLHRYFNTKSYKQIIKGYTFLNTFTKSRIQETLARQTMTGEEDFLQRLLKLDLSLEDASSILLELFTAGIDSTASALSFMFYNLARFPEKQDKLRTELNTELPNREPITTDTLRRLSYLKACLKESFRMHFPILGGTARILDKDMEICGYNVPKGTILAMNNQEACLRTEWVSKPDQFIPERWLAKPEASVKRPESFVLLPFGYGSRMCIGRRFAEQEVWLATAKIVQNFRLVYEGEPVKAISKLFNTPDRPLNMKFVDAQ